MENQISSSKNKLKIAVGIWGIIISVIGFFTFIYNIYAYWTGIKDLGLIQYFIYNFVAIGIILSLVGISGSILLLKNKKSGWILSLIYFAAQMFSLIVAGNLNFSINFWQGLYFQFTPSISYSGNHIELGINFTAIAAVWILLYIKKEYIN